jgi:uncharacterized membrane protein (UPF0182 family)
MMVLLVLAAFLLLGLVPTVVQFYTDLLWFQEIGFTRVLLTELGTRGALFLIVLVVSFAFFFANLRFAQRGVVPFPLRLQLAPETPPVDIASALQRLTLPVSALIALLFALGASPSWLLIQRFLHRTEFGFADPVFSRDVGYYVFTLPALSAIAGLLFAYVIIALLMTVPLYLLRGDLIVRRRVRIESSAGMHVGLLLALLFVLLAVRTWVVHIPELLYSTTGPLVGASYTDLQARLPALRIISFAATAAAIAVIVGAVRQRVVLYAVVAGGAFMLIAVIGGAVVPAAVQRLIVEPTELTREAPQLSHYIGASRAAWGLDRVQVRSLSGDARLSLDDLSANAATIENVRLWDRDPLLQTFGQLQEIRTYYDFGAVDDDRYWIDGRYRQVLLSPRELNTSLLPSRSFINEHLVYTHGMGLTLAPVNQVTPEGLPVLFIKDLPPAGTVDLRVTQPRIYFGEQTAGHVFVNTNQREFDYPAGDRNMFTAYDGRGGIRIGSIGRRAMFASRFGSLRTLLSGDITSDSRVLMHRQVQQRVRRALPFLRFDRDPYMVIAGDGTLHWIFDAYTGTARYPYSYRLADGTSYMRNSVKVTVDAYHGDVNAYIADPADPLVRVYDRIFPGIFHSFDELRADLKPRLRYPEDLYRIQTQLYTIFHMDEAGTFYQREDELQIPVLGRGERQEPFMRRIIMRLPDETDPEFIFMTQFTPRGRNNLAAWMVARNDGDRLGELVVYRFPRQSLVFGPRQIVDRINQDPEIARQISLWDQGGSTVIRGELLVIPIEEALIYVQPIYLRAEGGRIPELKRVVVAYENQVVMEETLDESLEVLFGVRPPTPTEILADAPREPGAAPALPSPAAPAADDTEMLRRMQEQYERTRTEVERLGDLIRQWQQRRRDGGG